VKIGIRSSAILIGILFASNAPAQARDTSSSNYYLPGCQIAIENPELVKASDYYKTGLCMGVVTTLFSLAGDHINNICAPPTSTVNQALRVVVQFLKQHPEATHLSFIELAIEAMAEAWPCRK
jgi:hypothetical protein